MFARMFWSQTCSCLICALMVLLGPTSCTPSANTTGPDDPCAMGADCDQQTFGEVEVATTASDAGFRSVITGPVGTAEISWSISGDTTTFRYQPADGVLGPEVIIDGTPTDPAGAGRAAALLYSYDVASRSASKTLAPSVNPTTAVRYTGPNGVDNTSGCDQIHFVDCGTKGACCDAHDDCINEFCGGQGGCGNVLNALQAGYTNQPCDPSCLQCHGAVVRCFWDGVDHGPSHCCSAGDCGQAQECMIAGVVITDPCECEEAGIQSKNPADCDSQCPPNACHEDPPIFDFPGCIPDGDPSNSPCVCCSCVLRLTSPSTCSSR